METTETFSGWRHKILKYISWRKLPDRRGRPPLLYFGKLKEWHCLLAKIPRFLRSMGKFIIKTGVLGVPKGKKAQILPHEGFCLFFVTEMFLKFAFFLVTSVQEKFWLHIWSNTMIGWQRILLGFRPSRTFTLSMTSYSQISLFKACFSFTWHLESPYTDLFQFKHECTCLFATNLKN